MGGATGLVTMAMHRKKQKCKLEQIFKASLSSDYSLKLRNIKEELLVIAYQNGAVKFEHALYTPPVTTWNIVVL